MTKIIDCKNLKVSYKNNTVIENLNFSVEKGDFFLILGKNGSGKTTLMKSLLKLIPFDEGEISKDFKYCGYMSQEINFKKDFPSTVYEFVLSSRAIYSKFFYNSSDVKIANENLEKLNLTELKNKSINSLSIGQKQRVLLCRCLCVSSDIIFLDEPTNSLDIDTRREMYRILNELNKEGLTVVMISHDEESFKYSNRALVLGEEYRVVENPLSLYENGGLKFD